MLTQKQTPGLPIPFRFIRASSSFPPAGGELRRRMSGAGQRPTTSWRAVAAAALALWLLPAVLALAILWLPLLCCAVAAVRFRRVREKLLLARGSSRGCGGDDGGPEEEEATVDAGCRLRLLQQYLDDQMELVGGGHAQHGAGSEPEDHHLLDPTAKQYH